MYTLVVINWNNTLSTITAEYRVIRSHINEVDKPSFNAWVESNSNQRLFVNGGQAIVMKETGN